MKTLKKVIAGALAMSLLFAQSSTTALAANTPKATKSLTLTKAQKSTIKVTGKYIKSKSFKSTNTKVATVSKKGVVTAKNPGNCKIKITVTYRKTKKAKKLVKKVLTTKVTVKETDNNNATDLETLKKIIKQQVASGAKISRDFDDESVYTWDKQTGRLTGIYWSWSDIELKGSISFSKLTALKNLDCHDNQLTSLEVSGCTALENLDCSDNQLTGLDVSANTALKVLNCGNNQLTSLDVSRNTALEDLSCLNNQLIRLDVSRNTALKDLECGDNQLTSLDISRNTALTDLGCAGNQLTSLDVSANTALKFMICCENQLTSLDVSRNTALEDLNCCVNQITSLDVSGCTALMYLSIDEDVDLIGASEQCEVYRIDPENPENPENPTEDDDNLRPLDPENPAVVGNKNASDVEALTEIIEAQVASGASVSTDLDSDEYTWDEETGRLIGIEWYLLGLQLKGDISFSKLTALETLNCSDNQLTSLDVSRCTALKKLWCYDSQLTSLDVSGCTALKYLDCFQNKLTSLDVSRCTALEELWCSDNQLTSLDVSGCTALDFVDADDSVNLIRAS